MIDIDEALRIREKTEALHGPRAVPRRLRVSWRVIAAGADPRCRTPGGESHD
jgi:hypothetical protein